MRKPYSIEELCFYNDSEDEQKRTRKIFAELLKAAENEKPLLVREKEFLCRSMRLSLLEKDGPPEKYNFCSDFLFKELYLTYFSEHFGTVYYKPHKGKLRPVSEGEKKKDLKYLNRIYQAWLKKIEIPNHKEQLLQSIGKEIRDELKAHDKRNSLILFRKQKEEYILQKKKIVLHSKFIYLLVKSIAENSEPDDFKLTFLGMPIEITEHSLVHIINRHYAEVIKQNLEKSYHTEDFKPDFLHHQLKDILLRIDKKKILEDKEIRKLAFVYNDVPYQVWINKRQKFAKGEQVDYYRVDTFYPVEDSTELKKLGDSYELETVDEDLKVYKRKPNPN